MKLYTYFRSSAAFRVRIALNLKGISFEPIAVNLKPGVDAQLSDDYAALNPQKRVPLLVDDERVISQSTAIIEYLDEQYPQNTLLPLDIATRAQVRELVNLIACDIHPLNNLSVLKKLKADFSATQEQVDQWYRDWIVTGFTALETRLAASAGQFCVADTITMADVYLVPQVWNAYRFNVDLAAFPTLVGIYNRCLTMDAFTQALPEHQADNPER